MTKERANLKKLGGKMKKKRVQVMILNTYYSFNYLFNLNNIFALFTFQFSINTLQKPNQQVIRVPMIESPLPRLEKVSDAISGETSLLSAIKLQKGPSELAK